MRVAIVGAGPAGACLSYLLARRGLEVRLVERESDSGRVFRGEGLMPTGLDALAQMGLGPRLARVPRCPLERWEIFFDRRLVMGIAEPTVEMGDRAMCAMSQPRLLEEILAAATEHPGFRYEAPLTFREILREGGRVRGLRASGPRGDVELEADFVVGADGRASAVRGRAGLALELLPEHYDIVWMKLSRPAELDGRHPFQIFASGADAAFGYVSHDGRWQVGWVLDKGTWKTVRRRDWLPECAALLSEPLAQHLLAQRDALEGPSLLDVTVGRCPRWSAPGVLLLGDAAHPMSPIRAQGINMALRDAIVAANHLVPALRAGSDPGPACQAIQREREAEIVPVQAMQLREARGRQWARDHPWLMAPVLKLAPLLAGTRLAERRWLAEQKPMRFGLTEVQLSV